MRGRPPGRTSTTWATTDELNYLKRIGTHTENAPRSKRKRAERAVELLGRYIEAASLRWNWGQINKEQVLATANFLLWKFKLQLP